MSRLPDNILNSGGTPEDPRAGAGASEAMPIEEPRRAASLTLRSDDLRAARAASMDAANKSLAEALRITYALILGVMIVMVIIFAFSGFQFVDESERGIKVRLGRIVNSDLQPGFQLSLPYPLGEILKIPTGQVAVQIDDSFWPRVRPGDQSRPLIEVATMGPLRPGTDGSLLTGDSNLAHAQWTVVYSRYQPATYMTNVYTPSETAMVRAMVERAAVRVVGETPIDDLLKRGASRVAAAISPTPAPPSAPTPAQPDADGEAPADEDPPTPPAETPTQPAAPAGPVGSERENDIEARVRRYAQEGLDSIDSGIRIDAVSLRSLSPPRSVIEAFQEVQNAESAAQRKRDEALQERSRILNAIAGSAHTALLDLIDEYRRQLDLGHEDEAEATLGEIFAVLQGERDGRNIEIGGRTYAESRISGDVSRAIAQASTYRIAVVERARQQGQSFAAKLDQYRSNPRVFLAREWTEAMSALMSSGNVQAFMMPKDMEHFELLVNSDPEVLRELRREIQRREVEESLELRRALEAGKLIRREEER